MMTATKEANQERVFFVRYKWWQDWKEATSVELPTTSKAEFTLYHSKLHESLNSSTDFSPGSSSELTFELTREDSYLQSFDSAHGGCHYVLLPECVWSQVIKWYTERESVTHDISSRLSSWKEATGDPLRLYLIASENRKITFKIREKDNNDVLYKKASALFIQNSHEVYIWDTSGKAKQAVANNENKKLHYQGDHIDEDMMLELHFYGIWKERDALPCHENGSNGNGLATVPFATSLSQPLVTENSGSNRINSRNSSPDLSVSHPFSASLRNTEGLSNNTGSSFAGLIGLVNLGNTCFMNSALQCLVHTPKLVEYFLDDYSGEINRLNPLGMGGELALAFGDLLRKLWALERIPVAPRVFKAKLARFAPQFSGYNQHDSQELLAFLLDGLHEDLNRVRDKPYIESKDSDGRPDEEVAREYWKNHLARNDSIIVDLFQGQFKSTLVCPKCDKVSVTFDPFMYLSLPLPSNLTRAMTVTVISANGSIPPTIYTVNVPKQVKYRDLVQAVSNACSLKNEEKLLFAEVYNHKILRYLEDSYNIPLSIRDDQLMEAFRLQKGQEEGIFVEFINCRQEVNGSGSWRPFGVPLVVKHQDRNLTGSDIQSKFHTLIKPLLRKMELSAKENSDEIGVEAEIEAEMSNNLLKLSNGSSSESPQSNSDIVLPNGHSTTSSSSKLTFHLEEKGAPKDLPIELNEAVPIFRNCKRVQIFVHWTEEMLEKYDMQHLENLFEGLKFGLTSKRLNQESVSLYACLEAFLKEEPLGPEDMWYCPRCKDHCQASKKLDLWRLPEILVVHLKRFSYNRFLKNKLETFVNFPTHDLDLQNYVTHNNESQSTTYELYAVSNHYGSMGGGHYTAYVKLLEDGRWYNFDDSHVAPVTEDRIKTSAAYVLFYRRVKPENYTQEDGAVC